MPYSSLQLPGTCWTCKWVLNKVKKVIGPNVTAEVKLSIYCSKGRMMETSEQLRKTPCRFLQAIASVLSRVCNQMGFLKSKCKTFVKDHLSVLVEELSTTDDVRSMCVNAGACK